MISLLLAKVAVKLVVKAAVAAAKSATVTATTTTATTVTAATALATDPDAIISTIEAAVVDSPDPDTVVSAIESSMVYPPDPDTIVDTIQSATSDSSYSESSSLQDVLLSTSVISTEAITSNSVNDSDTLGASIAQSPDLSLFQNEVINLSCDIFYETFKSALNEDDPKTIAKNGVLKGISRRLSSIIGGSITEAVVSISDFDRSLLKNDALLSKIIHEAIKAIIDGKKYKEIRKLALIGGISEKAAHILCEVLESEVLVIAGTNSFVKKASDQKIDIKELEITVVYELFKASLQGHSEQETLKRARIAGFSKSIIVLMLPIIKDMVERYGKC